MSRSTVSPRQRRLHTAISRYSVCAKRPSLSRLSKSRTPLPLSHGSQRVTVSLSLQVTTPLLDKICSAQQCERQSASINLTHARVTSSSLLHSMARPSTGYSGHRAVVKSSSRHSDLHPNSTSSSGMSTSIRTLDRMSTQMSAKTHRRAQALHSSTQSSTMALLRSTGIQVVDMSLLSAPSGWAR